MRTVAWCKTKTQVETLLDAYRQDHAEQMQYASHKGHGCHCNESSPSQPERSSSQLSLSCPTHWVSWEAVTQACTRATGRRWGGRRGSLSTWDASGTAQASAQLSKEAEIHLPQNVGSNEQERRCGEPPARPWAVSDPLHQVIPLQLKPWPWANEGEAGTNDSSELASLHRALISSLSTGQKGQRHKINCLLWQREKSFLPSDPGTV